jgi:hypothetical protein
MNHIDDSDDGSTHYDNGTVATEDTVMPLHNRLAAELNGLSITKALLDAGLTISDVDEAIVAESEHAKAKLGTIDIEIEFGDSDDNDSVKETSSCESEDADDGYHSENDHSSRLFDDDFVLNGLHSIEDKLKDTAGPSALMPGGRPLFPPGFAVHRRSVKVAQHDLDPMIIEKERIKRERAEESLRQRVSQEDNAMVVSDDDPMNGPYTIDPMKRLRRQDKPFVQSLSTANLPDTRCGGHRAIVESDVTGASVRNRLGNPPSPTNQNLASDGDRHRSLLRSTSVGGILVRISQQSNRIASAMKGRKVGRTGTPDEQQEGSARSSLPVMITARMSKQQEARRAEIQTDVAIFQAAARLEREKRKLGLIKSGGINLGCERQQDVPVVVSSSKQVQPGSPSQDRPRFERPASSAESDSGTRLLSNEFVSSSTRNLGESETTFHSQRSGAPRFPQHNMDQRSTLEHVNFCPLRVSQSLRHLPSDESPIDTLQVNFDNAVDLPITRRSQSYVDRPSRGPSERSGKAHRTTHDGVDNSEELLDIMRGRRAAHISFRQDTCERSDSYRSQSQRSDSYRSQSQRSDSYRSQSQRSDSYRSQGQRSDSYRSQSQRSDSYRSQGQRSDSYRSQSQRSDSFQSQSHRSDSYRSQSQRSYEESPRTRSPRSYEDSHRSRCDRSQQGEEMQAPFESGDSSRRVRVLITPPLSARERCREGVQGPPFCSQQIATSPLHLRRTAQESPLISDRAGPSNRATLYSGVVDHRQGDPPRSSWSLEDAKYEYDGDSFPSVPHRRSSVARDRILRPSRHHEPEDTLHEHDRIHFPPNHHHQGRPVDRCHSHPGSSTQIDVGRREATPLRLAEGVHSGNDSPNREGQTLHENPLSRHNQRGLAEVEICPGVWRKLRGADETWEAVMAGDYIPTTCLDCCLSLLVIANAEMVVCPSCRVVSPILDEDSGFSVVTPCSSSPSPSPSSPVVSTVPRHGVGLGFLVEDLMKWQNEIKRGIDPRYGGRRR